jgi:ATPase subunit of ABC transporter with duplicated ATPase domains
VLVLDEPTNHLDLESIEALVEGLQKYPGTLILVSHDRWFINQLATRIVDIEPEGITDYQGTYEEYVAYSGDDRLDVEKVVLKAKSEKTGKKKEPAAGAKPKADAPKLNAHQKKVAQDRHAELMHLISVAEGRLAEIDALFAAPDFYSRSSNADRRKLEEERADLTQEVAGLTAEWEKAEERIGASR